LNPETWNRSSKIVDCLFKGVSANLAIDEFVINDSAARGRLLLMLSYLPNLKCAFTRMQVGGTKSEILRRLALDGSSATGYRHNMLPEESEDTPLHPLDDDETAAYTSLLYSLSDAYL
jgi:hypothetical protein